MTQATTSPTHETPVPKPLREPDPDPEVGLYGKFIQWGEKKVSELSTRNNFWHRFASWVFLPLAYRSGIKFHRREAADQPFECIVPFSRFNKNWYNAMAGAALLANSEVAGGMYVFQQCGADYTVVCKHMEYKFRRPCYGPALYRCIPREAIEPLVASGGEFNVTLDMTILQAVLRKDEKEKRCGECVVTFHVAPKSKHRARQAKLAERNKRAEERG